MEELQNEQTLTSSQTAVAEENVGEVKEEVSLGKFKDVNALLNAYNSLQAEFTKRCQKIKELEGNVDEANAPTEKVEVSTEVKQDITDGEKEKILKDYLKDILGEKKKMVFLENDGVSIKTKGDKPKTIDEAGSLAKSIFNN